MFGIDLVVAIPVMVLLYSLVALAFVSYGAHRKNSEVPELVAPDYSSRHYALRYSKAQKSRRDFWECVQVFSFAWPLEIVVGSFMGVFQAIAGGIRFLINSSASRSKQVAERKILSNMEDELARLNSIVTPTREERSALESLTSLVEKQKIPMLP